MKYLLIFILALMPFSNPTSNIVTDVDDDKIGEVVLYIKGEGKHKVELLNPQLFDTLYLYINVRCKNDNPYILRRVSGK